MAIPVDIVVEVPASGTLPESRRMWLDRMIASYAGGRVWLRITKPRRSSSSNRYMWGIVYATICRALADAGQPTDAEYLHEYFKRRYLPRRAVYVFGREVILPGTTTELTSDEFADFVDAVITDPAVEALGVYVPTPGEYQAEHGTFKSYAIAEP